MKKIKFRYPELLKQIRQNKQVQFTTDIDGKATRISWKRISLTNWLLIQLTPLDTPETIPGMMSGITTFARAFTGLHPKSIAASYSESLL